jgi:hypothetical protein
MRLPRISKRRRPADDPVIAAALAYETATLHALAVLDRTKDGLAQRGACIRWAKHVTAIEAMSPADKFRALSHVQERGRVPDHSWQLIYAAMKVFVGDWPYPPPPRD